MAVVDPPAVLAVRTGNSVKICAVRQFAYLDEALVKLFLDPSLLRDEFGDQDAMDAFDRRARAGNDIN